MREMFAPAGVLVLGHEHRTEHFNIVLSGRAIVWVDGKMIVATAGQVLTSKPGRKLVIVLEDLRWLTVHPTTVTDLEQLERDLLVKSEVWIAHEKQCFIQAKEDEP